jgi:hypothetical protein
MNLQIQPFFNFFVADTVMYADTACLHALNAALTLTLLCACLVACSGSAPLAMPRGMLIEPK